MRLWENKKNNNFINNDANSKNLLDDETEIRKTGNSKNYFHSTNNLHGLSANIERIHYVFMEYDALRKNPIEGIYITPGADTPLVWFGLLIVRTGIFYGGIFRFSITIPEDFPDTNMIPIAQFDEPLFHPSINPKNNCVDMSRFFPSGWQRGRNHLYQVITAIQGIFFSYQCDSSQAANPEAAILLKDNRRRFIQLAHDAVRRSRTQVYAVPNSDDQNNIKFTPWNDSEMEPYRLFLLNGKELPNDEQNMKIKTMKNGISWINSDVNSNYLCDISPN